MPGRLTAEDVVTIHVLSEKEAASRAIARQLGVTEGAVRYHLRRRASGATDGRAGKAFAASALAEVVDAFCAATADGERPANLKALYEHLRAEHGYAASYKSVVRYVRARFGRPPLRTDPSGKMRPEAATVDFPGRPSAPALPTLLAVRMDHTC